VVENIIKKTKIIVASPERPERPEQYLSDLSERYKQDKLSTPPKGSRAGIADKKGTPEQDEAVRLFCWWENHRIS
jgi:hypothetical protein